MNKKIGKIILAIIIAVQILVPSFMIALSEYREKQFEQKGEEIKLALDYVELFYDDFGEGFEDGAVNVGSLEFDSSMMYVDEPEFVVFEKGEDGYSFCAVKEKNPETDIYLRQNNYDLRQLTYDIDIEDVDSLPRDLYSKEYEKTNIMEGYCDGPQTEAYAILKVYKNRRKVVGVYIDGLKLEEVLEKYKNGEMDLNRYQWHSEFDDWYDDEEDMESVTEPLLASDEGVA